MSAAVNIWGWAPGWPGLGWGFYSSGNGMYVNLLENSPDPANDTGTVAFFHGSVVDGVWTGSSEFYRHTFSSLAHWAAKASSWDKAYWTSSESGIYYCRAEMWEEEIKGFFTRSY